MGLFTIGKQNREPAPPYGIIMVVRVAEQAQGIPMHGPAGGGSSVLNIVTILPPADPEKGIALAILFLLKICVEQVIIKKITEE